jgi:hypothetical protein
MSDNTQTVSGGIGFTGLLTIVFIVLKLTHVIAWSWWWVWSPLWIPTGALLLFLGFCVLMVFATGQVKR